MKVFRLQHGVLSQSTGIAGEAVEAHGGAHIAVPALAELALAAPKVGLGADLLPDFVLPLQPSSDLLDRPGELVSDDERQRQSTDGVRTARLGVEVRWRAL